MKGRHPLAAGVERMLSLGQNAFDCVNNGLGLAVNLDVNQATDLDRSKCRAINCFWYEADTERTGFAVNTGYGQTRTV